MKKILTVLLCCFSAAAALAQTKGVVSVVKDPMIDSLIAKRIELSLKSATVPTAEGTPKPGTMLVSQMGFRVQIFYGFDRREVFAEQTKFNTEYPELNTYITFKQPNYYLRVGDFRTRLEAQRLMNELKGIFPTMFIFREKINAPNLNYSND